MCSPNPCKNGATCAIFQQTFTCTCADGWSGALCDSTATPEQQLATATPAETATPFPNLCLAQPCHNAGFCSPNATDAKGFTCLCAPGWSGPTCDDKLDMCSPNPCKNGATCAIFQQTFTCTCADGWSGALCDSTATPEQQLATATPAETVTPFPNLCLTQPCHNAGFCSPNASAPQGFTCLCAPGWSGPTFDDKLD
eukprot:158441_1